MFYIWKIHFLKFKHNYVFYAMFLNLYIFPLCLYVIECFSNWSNLFLFWLYIILLIIVVIFSIRIMDNGEFSSFSWALYQITEQEKFFTLLKNFISVTTGIECHLFDNTFHFLLSLKNSMLQLQHIFVMIGVDVNSPSIYHGPI